MEILARDGTFITYVEVPAWFGWFVEFGPYVALVLVVGLALHFGAIAWERWVDRRAGS